MSTDPLVPTSALQELHGELLRKIEQLDQGYAITPDPIGDALARALLFEHWPELVKGFTIDPTSALYNRYFWYCRYVTLRQQQEGPNDGLEQGLFHILAKTSLDLDWKIVEQLESRGREGWVP